MNYVAADTIDRLTDDALRVAISLDSFTTPDWAEKLGPAIQRGNEQLATLQQRREQLILNHADDAIIDRALEIIQTRLKFLEVLHSRNPHDELGYGVNRGTAATEGARIARG